MFNKLTKIVFSVSCTLLCVTANSSSKISKDFIGEEKKEILAPVEEKKEILDAVEKEEDELTKGGEKAAIMTIPLPANMLVRGDLIIVGIERNAKYPMRNNGSMKIDLTGAVIRDPDTWGVKIQHPGSDKKAKIEIYALIGEGDSARLIAQYEGSFAKIARMIVPYLSSDLIQDDALPSSNGWKGIFGVTPDDDNGIHMFSPFIAAYYNSMREYTLVWDVGNPVLNSSIDTSPNDSERNFVYKTVVATLDPTDPTLPTYNSGTAPCGVETVGAEKIYHIPFGIGCKAPTTIIEGVTYIPSVDIRGAGKVILKGNNSYLMVGTVYVRKGVEAVVTLPASMPQSNIAVQPDMSGGNSTLSFVANGTPFAMRSGTTLTVKDGGIVDVPLNATLNLGVASVAMEAGSTMSIDGTVRF